MEYRISLVLECGHQARKRAVEIPILLLCAFQGGDDGNDVNVSPDGSRIYFADHGSGFYVFSNDCVDVLVHSYSAAVEEGGVKVAWTLAEPIDAAGLAAQRRDGRDGPFLPVAGATIERTGRDYLCYDAGYRVGADCIYGVVRDVSGESSVLFEVAVGSDAPSLPVTLYQNHPNPFNPTTQIRYYVPERSRVRLTIYDVSGRRVAQLVDDVRDVGFHNEIWTGRDDAGREAASGVHFCRLVVGTRSVSGKIVLLR
jgi:hypothetical protein